MKNVQRKKSIRTIARAFVGMYFVVEGLSKLAGYNESITIVEKIGLPLESLIVLVIAIFEITLGIFLMFKYHTKFTTLLLMIYLFTTTLILNLPTISESVYAQQLLLKDLAIVSILLYIHGHSRGISHWFSRRANSPIAEERFDIV